MLAGLFSAVVTSFLVEEAQNLRPDYTKLSATLLHGLVSNSGGIGSSLPNLASKFVPDARDVWVNGLRAVSLIFSLVVASSWSMAPTLSTRVYFDRDGLALSTTMTSQSLVKHFLTEGDKFILSWFSPLQDQGGYALAVNYVTSSSSSSFSSTSPTSHEPDQNPQPDRFTKAHTFPALLKSSRTLLTLLNIQLATSLFILIFGTHYLTLFLTLLLPPRYLHTTSAPKVLEAWVWYIPFLAVNGGLEAFFSSCAGREDVGRQSRWMVLFTVLYKAGFGDVSLVYANIVNLVVRIGYAWMFCRRFFSEHYNSSSSRGGDGGGSNSELDSHTKELNSESDSTEEALINLRLRTILPPRSLVLLLAISTGLIRTSRDLGRDIVAI
ncbi:hypothetical protein D9757_012799 [Collybiopsis confluens]|uniref:Man(5)GlcNAc(2)-PP-dolichol translocation protein RFT1 n=1 Tax=Collybiopsis confluens TaxID=2823264 RepID=A0A8H5GJE9_9AGAR|nr:hypothetical protein D9757_012799 [Collybiopsis confluens]